jgi:hypothetical protein
MTRKGFLFDFFVLLLYFHLNFSGTRIIRQFLPLYEVKIEGFLQCICGFL